MSSCFGATGSRPNRPATSGRVEGFTFQSKCPPFERYLYSSASGNSRAGPTSVPKSFCHTGEVDDMKLFRIFSVQPFGALPLITE
jgi:hypothetical protein